MINQKILFVMWPNNYTSKALNRMHHNKETNLKNKTRNLI